MFILFQHPEWETTIYTNGCYGEVEQLINDLLKLLGGIILEIIIFEVIIVAALSGMLLSNCTCIFIFGIDFGCNVDTWAST